MPMNEDIIEFFHRLIDQSGSYDIANAEFKRLLGEDQDLRNKYLEWCDSCGYSQREGFHAFCNEYMDNQDSIWDSLNDYDE